MNKFFMLAIG